MDSNNNNVGTNEGNPLVNKLRVFLIMIIFGYFLIKLVFAMFGVYPDKYYNQTITLNTNLDSSPTQIVNAYVPGVWNSELTDFLIMVIMCVILFFVKFNGPFPFTSSGNKMNYALWVPFIVGLVVPAIKVATSVDSAVFNNVTSVAVLIIGGFIMIFNIISSFTPSYLVFSGLIIVTAVMLYVLRNRSNIFSNVLYNVRDKNSENCTRYDMENIIVKSSGEQFSVNLAFITWLTLMLFSFNGGAVKDSLNGLLLGIFVGSVSFTGMEYPIIKTASDFCSSPTECQQKGIPHDSMTTSVENCDVGTLQKLDQQTTVLEGKINTNTWTVVAISLTLILLLLYMAINIKK